MIIYGSAISPYVRKLIVFCAEAGLDYEYRAERPHSDNPDFRAASPLGKIPAMDDDGFTLFDSTAIALYLHAKHQTSLLPADPQGYGRGICFDEIADTVLFPAMQPIFWNRIVAPLFNGTEGDEGAARKAEEETLPPVLDWLEASLPNEGFLLGEAFSLADIAMASPLVNYTHIYGGIDAARYPRIAAYAARVHCRPSFAGTIAREEAGIAKARARHTL